ncbi:RB1-inducible coiled-coil protein 1-like [Anneissia japonica]|uniref:RB1-inducible coiled-coil protein 1-like n=1 Tax=Anneissia japonica TaxID=1529436 RepID=UPI00142565E8|nr:RB1-inducible coiled-coil protein 1-like [Anneissia japonica]
MLHIFIVNSGTMVTMDMIHMMHSVPEFQRAIQEEYGIPVEKQVLLVSGGQSLDVHKRVCDFNAGTDTSPIYMFDKFLIEQASYQMSPSLTEDATQPSDYELKEQVEAFRNLPPSYNAVSSRTQMALQLHDLAKEKVKSCEIMVRDQHQQQQGWMAVVANLEDISSAFHQRAKAFELSLTDFMSKRTNYFKMLSEFPDVLSQLERIPLPPCLVDSARFESESDRDSMTLMRWISRQDQRSSLVNMYQQCAKSLEQFEPEALENFRCDINDVIEKVDNPGMKEIKGLGDRLFGLEQLLAQAKKTRQDQGEMAQGFVQNQSRFSNLKDTSVLPQLCDSHQKQLVVMLKNHLQLREISRRCLIAKGELCKNLHVRLRWIMFVEQQITGIHSKMVVYHENLKRLKKRLEIADQVYNSPTLFAKALAEIYLRRQYEVQFSQRFGAVSEMQLKEVDRRKELSIMMQTHFLNALFPGLSNLPPAVTLEHDVSDGCLPTVTLEDIQLLKDQVPELNYCLELHIDVLSKTTQTVDMKCLEEPEDELSKSQSEHLNQMKEELVTNKTLHSLATEGTNEILKNADHPIEESVETLINEPLEDVLEDVGSLSETAETMGTHSMVLAFGSALSPDTDNFLSTRDSVEMPFYSLAGGIQIANSYQPGHLHGSNFQEEELEEVEGKLEDLKREKEDIERKCIRQKEELQRKIEHCEGKLEKFEIEYEDLRVQHQNKERKLEEIESGLGSIYKRNSHLEEMLGDSTKSLLAGTKLLRNELETFKNFVFTFSTENMTSISQFTSSVEYITKEYDRIEIDNSNLVKEISQLKEEYQVASVFKEKYECLLGEHEKYRTKIKEENKMMDKSKNEKEAEHQKILKKIEKLEKDLELVTKELLAEKDIRIQNEESLTKQLEVSNKDLQCMNKQLIDAKEENKQFVQAIHKHKQQIECEKQEIVGLKLCQEVEISELKLLLKEKDVLLQRSNDEKMELLQKKEQEKKTEISDLIVQFKYEKKEELKDFEKMLRKQWRVEIQEMSLEELIVIKPEIQSAEKINEDKENALKELQKSHEMELQSKLEELERNKDEEIALAKQQAHLQVQELLEKYQNCEEKYHDLQKQSKMQTSQMEASFMTDKQSEVLAAVEEERKKHKHKMDKLRSSMEENHKKSIKAMLEEADARHFQEIQEMARTFDEDKLNSLEDMKTSIQADKQIHFNAALSKVSLKKDKEIETLKKKLAEHEEQQQIDKESIDKLLSENSNISEIVKQTLSNKEAENNKLKEENKSLLQTKQELIERCQQGQAGASSLEESVVCMPKSTQSFEDKASGGHRLAKTKDNTDFRKKMLESASSGSKAEKISIIDISVGDLVLIYFEEQNDNYVVFTRGTTLYFVHADSLQPLGLKPHDPSKRAWIIGRITDKEYCQAKKAQNRFKVPVGTKFYRVKAESCSIREHRRTKAESKS